MKIQQLLKNMLQLSLFEKINTINTNEKSMPEDDNDEMEETDI